jgi:hypothetical protein
MILGLEVEELKNKGIHPGLAVIEQYPYRSKTAEGYDIRISAEENL